MRKKHVRTEKSQLPSAKAKVYVETGDSFLKIVEDTSLSPTLQCQGIEEVLNHDSNDVEMIEDDLNEKCANNAVSPKINGEENRSEVDQTIFLDDVNNLDSKVTEAETSPIEIDARRPEIVSNVFGKEVPDTESPLNPSQPILNIISTDVDPPIVIREVRPEIDIEPHQQQSTQTEPIVSSSPPPPATQKRSHADIDGPDEVASVPPSKRLCAELERNFGAHDKTLRDYINDTANNSLDEVRRHLDQLQSDIVVLNELSDAKEIEWNNILHLKKCKEEIIVRLNRRKIVMEIMASKVGDVPLDLDEDLPSVNKQMAKELKNECVGVAAFSQPALATSGAASITQSILASRANMKSADLVKEKANTTRLHR